MDRDGAGTSAPVPTAGGSNSKPVCIIVLGMAGSGKTTFVKKLVEHLDANGGKPYTINLDPAVFHVPYHANIDIRDTVKFKEVMKQYGFGPNGAIMTSLNFFTAHFNKVVQLIEKNANNIRHVIIDTPGQIEVFTWSASGVIITEVLSSSYPTIIVYVMDTPRSHNPVTFMSNMLYACSVLYRMKSPFVCVLNKTDIIDCEFAIEWMRDFESFQTALSVHRGGAGQVAGLDQFDAADGPGASQDTSQYMSSLTSSLSLVLDDFYSDLRCCGVSSLKGDGIDQFMQLVSSATEEYYSEFLPALKKANEKKWKARPSTSLLTVPTDEKISDDNSSSSSDESATFQSSKAGATSMLIDMIGNSDNADNDLLANLDGIEERPHEVAEEIDDSKARLLDLDLKCPNPVDHCNCGICMTDETFRRQCKVEERRME